MRFCSLYQVKRAHTFRRSCSIHRLGLHERVTGYLELANAIHSAVLSRLCSLFTSGRVRLTVTVGGRTLWGGERGRSPCRWGVEWGCPVGNDLILIFLLIEALC